HRVSARGEGGLIGGAQPRPQSPVGLYATVLARLLLIGLAQVVAWIAAGRLLGVAPNVAWGVGAVLGTVLLVLVASTLAEAIRRTTPLYRAIMRSMDGARVPPSQAALRDVEAAPRWLGLAVAAPAVAASVWDGLSGSALFHVGKD